ncbi:MAG: hypothetical protein HJJLKODD_01577 [Phycisphaerae bacterium]|nr:hypothetical protein [Phycisphaerae bacterium]
MTQSPDHHLPAEPLSPETLSERMRAGSKQVMHGLIVAILFFVVLQMSGMIPAKHDSGGAAHPTTAPVAGDAHSTPDSHPASGVATTTDSAASHDSSGAVHGAGIKKEPPPYWAVLPFVAILLGIALFPLIPSLAHKWHHNRNKFIVALILSIITLAYYGTMHPGGLNNHFTGAHDSAAGLSTVTTVVSNAMFEEFLPFIVLLFSLYVISGGLNLRGDLPAHPLTNCAFLGIGTVLASFIGTTGAAMVLIRPLIATNEERKYKVHTIVFFIFTVCNCGGLLLPIGDPPLFLGYLKGVPFLWTLKLLPFWVGTNLLLLAIYYVWDRRYYAREAAKDIIRDETQVRRLVVTGKLNLLLLLGVVLSVALLVPGKNFLETSFIVPTFFREAAMLILVCLSLQFTAPQTRVLNNFDYTAIVEVAALFFGIFITMQVPIEILNARGAELGLSKPWQFFWASGMLSSFLDNAPTYVVFFETANALTHSAGEGILQLLSGHYIREDLLIAISLGAVFMGANTYIGNGPNFMVKSIAEQSNIKMPSFFGYMLYSVVILIPCFILISVILALT